MYMYLHAMYMLSPISSYYFTPFYSNSVIAYFFDKFSWLMGDNSLLNANLLKIKVFIVVYKIFKIKKQKLGGMV